MARGVRCYYMESSNGWWAALYLRISQVYGFVCVEWVFVKVGGGKSSGGA